MRLLLFVLAGSLTAGCQDDVILRHTFEKDNQGWMAMGGGSIAVTKDASQVKSGNGALAFTYDLSAPGFAAALLPAPGMFTSMQQMRFWIKADHDTAVGVLLSEKKPGGGDYSALVWAPANSWQHVQLTPADFVANDGPTDPVDSDGKLDLDQVQAVGIIDLAQFFNTMTESADFPLVVTKTSGKHVLLVDDFDVLNSAPKARQAKENTIPIDAFDQPTLSWITLGGMDLKLSQSGNPLGGPALEAAYEAKEGQFTILSRRVPAQDYSKAKRLIFDIASEREVTLAVSMEVRKVGASQGPRYLTTIVPPAGKKAFHVDISLSEFEYDGNSPPDSTAKLDPARIKSLTFTDISTAAGGEGGPNRIWISTVEMKK